MSQIGTWLKESRQKAGLTQEEAAVKIGVSYKTIGRWERGENPPSGDLLVKAADVYGSDLSRLDINVPRGTKMAGTLREASPEYPNPVTTLLLRMERELIRQGATDAEVDFARSALLTGGSMALVSEAAGSEAMEPQLLELQRLADDVRAMMLGRIARRQPPAPKPIKPADLPALQAERLRELGADEKKKRSTK